MQGFVRKWTKNLVPDNSPLGAGVRIHTLKFLRSKNFRACFTRPGHLWQGGSKRYNGNITVLEFESKFPGVFFETPMLACQ